MSSKPWWERREDLPFDGVWLGTTTHTADSRTCPERCEGGEVYTRIHVMSTHAGGEIRSYILRDGEAWPDQPCYTGVWPEMDVAVAEALGARVVPYTVSAGGCVEVTQSGPGTSSDFDGGL